MFKSIAGWVLAMLSTASAVAAIAGIWGLIDGDTTSQMIGTFIVLALLTWVLSYVTTSFFGSK